MIEKGDFPVKKRSSYQTKDEICRVIVVTLGIRRMLTFKINRVDVNSSLLTPIDSETSPTTPSLTKMDHWLESRQGAAGGNEVAGSNLGAERGILLNFCLLS